MEIYSLNSQVFLFYLKGPYSREITYLSLGSTGEIIGEPLYSSESTGPIDVNGWPDSGKLRWSRSMFGLVAVSAFVVEMHVRASGLFNEYAYLYCPPVFVQLAVTSRYTIHYCMFKNSLWIKIDHLWSSSRVHFPSAQIFAKSVRTVSKNYGDSREHRRRFVHHIFKLHATSCCAAMSGPKQLLLVDFRRCATEPLDRNTVQFIHA